MVGGLKIIRLKSGSGVEFERLFGELREVMRAQERGCIPYPLLKSREKAGAHVVHEQYRDRAALDAHQEAPFGSAYFPRMRAIPESINVEYLDGGRPLECVDEERA